MAPRIRLPWFSYLSECFSSVSFAPRLLLPASKQWSVTLPEPAALLCPICTCSPGDPRRSHSLRDYLEPFLRALVSRLFPSQQVFLDHLLQHHTCPSFSVLFQPFGVFFFFFQSIYHYLFFRHWFAYWLLLSYRNKSSIKTEPLFCSPIDPVSIIVPGIQ